MQEFRIHLCQSSASHSSLKDHERLAIACSCFCPMFAVPRSKVSNGFLEDTPCLCLSPLRPVMKERLSFLGRNVDFDAMRDRPCTTASQVEGRILSIYGGSLRCPSFHRQLQYLGFSGFLTDGLDLVCFQYLSTLRVNLSMFCCKGAA